MLRRDLGYELAIMAIICTLAIFLFPSVSGPYSIVHGPVTALRAMRLWLALLIGLTLTSLGLAKALWKRFETIVGFTAGFQPIEPLQQSSILRC
ncbi:MAG TPA: hypothetical protein VEH30_16480 [Terriglobales bacterium]|nr:hypothetical protein [Terriglobales bacterium]